MSGFVMHTSSRHDIALLTEGVLSATVLYKHGPPHGGQAHHVSRTPSFGAWKAAAHPSYELSGTTECARKRFLMNRFIQKVDGAPPQFRFETYSPDGSICLTAVILPFSSTNSTITSANSCTRNLSAL